ncbi:MAG: hypothetical protein HQK99_04890 [Nitrospirae bacterium]|nr:hypothetical protein [Nitrospirota bacterium]
MFFIDKLTLGPLAPVVLHDVFEAEFQSYKPMGELLFKYGLYFWYPNWPGGMPAFAGQHSPFYILNIAAQAVPLWAVYGGLVIATMVAAGYGMYRFLSGYLNAAGWVAVVGGVFFALNMQVWTFLLVRYYSYAFPLYFAWSWDFSNAPENQNVPILKLILKLIVINLLAAISYPVHTLPYFFILEVLVIVLLPPEGGDTRLRMLIKASLVWFGYILICLPVLYSLYKYIPFSQRTYVYETASLEGFLRSLFSGFAASSLKTMTLIPLAGAFAVSNKSARLRRSLMLLAIVVCISAVFTSGLKVLFRGTLFEKMDLGQITAVFPIVMTIAAFLAIDAVIKDRRLLRRFLIGEAAGVACAVVAVFTVDSIETQGVQFLILNIGSGIFISLMILMAENNEALSLPELAKKPAVVFLLCLSAIAAVFYFSPGKVGNVDRISLAPVLVVSTWAIFWFCEKLSGKSQNKRQLAGLLIITIGAVLFFQVRFTRFFGEEHVPYVTIFPDIDVLQSIKQENGHNPFRVASFDPTTIPGIQSQGFETPDGRGVLFNKYYKEFFKVVINPQLSDPGFLHYFETYWYNLFISNFTPDTLHYAYSFLNIRYVVARGISSETNGLVELIYEGNSVKEYRGIAGKIMRLYSSPIVIGRFKTAFDRYYMVNHIKTLKSDKDIYDTLVKTQGAELIDTVYFSGADVPSPMSKDTAGEDFKRNKMTLENYSPDEVSLRLELAVPAAVVVSNNYDPNWKAYVDGRQTWVFRANIAFQAIVIRDTGRHTLVFRYEDKPLKWLLILIPVGMLVFNYFMVAGRRIFFRQT